MNPTSTVSPSGSFSVPLRSVRRPVSGAPVIRKSTPTGNHFSLVRARPCKSLKKPKELYLRAHPPMAAAMTGKREPKLLVFGNEEELSTNLAEYVSRLSEKFVEERGTFSLVLSGGSLIKTLRKLTEPPYLGAIKWSRWHVFWVDERVVPKDNPDSNYKLAYDDFLSKVPILPGNVSAINDSLSADAAAEAYETGLGQLVKSEVVALSTESCFPKFDLILLGMGPDGHVASLFPGHPLLKESERWVTFLKDSPKPPPERITFTFPVINAASNIGIVVTGSGKADTVRTALEDVDHPDPLPVQMVSPEGELTWFADKAAFSLLQGSSSL